MFRFRLLWILKDLLLTTWYYEIDELYRIKHSWVSYMPTYSHRTYVSEQNILYPISLLYLGWNRELHVDNQSTIVILCQHDWWSEGREEERQRDSLTTESSPAPVVSPLTSPRMRQWVTVAQLTWCCLVVSRHLVVKQVRREEESLQSMNIYQFDSYFDVILHSSLKKDIKFRSYTVHNGAWIYRTLS